MRPWPLILALALPAPASAAPPTPTVGLSTDPVLERFEREVATASSRYAKSDAERKASADRVAARRRPSGARPRARRTS
jgi:hypothetical protein